jgi:hypothetical protein
LVETVPCPATAATVRRRRKSMTDTLCRFGMKYQTDNILDERYAGADASPPIPVRHPRDSWRRS